MPNRETGRSSPEAPPSTQPPDLESTHGNWNAVWKLRGYQELQRYAASPAFENLEHSSRWLSDISAQLEPLRDVSLYKKILTSIYALRQKVTYDRIPLASQSRKFAKVLLQLQLTHDFKHYFYEYVLHLDKTPFSYSVAARPTDSESTSNSVDPQHNGGYDQNVATSTQNFDDALTKNKEKSPTRATIDAHNFTELQKLVERHGQYINVYISPAALKQEGYGGSTQAEVYRFWRPLLGHETATRLAQFLNKEIFHSFIFVQVAQPVLNPQTNEIFYQIQSTQYRVWTTWQQIAAIQQQAAAILGVEYHGPGKQKTSHTAHTQTTNQIETTLRPDLELTSTMIGRPYQATENLDKLFSELDQVICQPDLSDDWLFRPNTFSAEQLAALEKQFSVYLDFYLDRAVPFFDQLTNLQHNTDHPTTENQTKNHEKAQKIIDELDKLWNFTFMATHQQAQWQGIQLEKNHRDLLGLLLLVAHQLPIALQHPLASLQALQQLLMPPETLSPEKHSNELTELWNHRNDPAYMKKHGLSVLSASSSLFSLGQCGIGGVLSPLNQLGNFQVSTPEIMAVELTKTIDLATLEMQQKRLATYKQVPLQDHHTWYAPEEGYFEKNGRFIGYLDNSSGYVIGPCNVALIAEHHLQTNNPKVWQPKPGMPQNAMTQAQFHFWSQSINRAIAQKKRQKTLDTINSSSLSTEQKEKIHAAVVDLEAKLARLLVCQGLQGFVSGKTNVESVPSGNLDDSNESNNSEKSSNAPDTNEPDVEHLLFTFICEIVKAYDPLATLNDILQNLEVRVTKDLVGEILDGEITKEELPQKKVAP